MSTRAPASHDSGERNPIGAHSIASAVREGVLVWFALLGGIGAWTVHLVFVASWVRLTCNRPGLDWANHAVTALTLAVTVAAMALSWRLVRAGRGEGHGAVGEDADTEAGRSQFIGILGLVIGAFNFALIALEELYIVVLHSHRCVV